MENIKVIRAYEGVITKEEFLKEIKHHQEQDNFIKGTYFENGKGCAVGCSLESISRLKGIKINDYGNYKRYEDLLGIPEWLARVEDAIFEGLSEEKAKNWTMNFSSAINPGANLDSIKSPFIIFILESNLERLQDNRFKNQRKAVEDCINLWKRPDLGSKEWDIAASSAAMYAESAAWSAAESAAWSAAESAAWSARSAMSSMSSMSSMSAAMYAAESAASSSARSAARSAAWSTAYEKFSNKLLELIKECR